MSSTDELREVEVEIKGNEREAQHGHQISMGDRDPTSMNDHVKVTGRKAAISDLSPSVFNPFISEGCMYVLCIYHRVEGFKSKNRCFKYSTKQFSFDN